MQSTVKSLTYFTCIASSRSTLIRLTEQLCSISSILHTRSYYHNISSMITYYSITFQFCHNNDTAHSLLAKVWWHLHTVLLIHCAISLEQTMGNCEQNQTPKNRRCQKSNWYGNDTPNRYKKDTSRILQTNIWMPCTILTERQVEERRRHLSTLYHTWRPTAVADRLHVDLRSVILSTGTTQHRTKTMWQKQHIQTNKLCSHQPHRSMLLDNWKNCTKLYW